MRCSALRIGLALLLLAHAASGTWHHAVAATALISTLRPARAQWQRAVAAITLTSTLRPVRGAWQAKGKSKAKAVQRSTKAGLQFPVTESARAQSYYSVSTGMQIARLPTPCQKCLIRSI